jgi:cytosine/adenosine deaminase-related metal-dependent hydrolase
VPEAIPLRERTRFRARWVVPVATAPVADGAVIIEGDRIAWVGPAVHAPGVDREVDLGAAILTPGLVNAHTHLDLTMLRGRLEGLPFFDWVRTVTQAHREVLTDDDRRDAALLGVAEGLQAGVTTFADTAANAAPYEAMQALGVRGIAFREVFGPDPAQCGESLRDLQRAVAAMRADEMPLVRVGVSPHAPYSVSDDLFRAVSVWAAAESLPVAVHIAESEAESALVERAEGPFAEFLRTRGIAVAPRGDRPMAVLGDAGLLRRGTLLIHCVRATDADVHDIALAGCGVAHCPGSNAFLGAGVAPLLEFLGAGARLGLGSDSMGSNDRMDLRVEAQRAISQQAGRLGRGEALTPAAAFRLATLGGAEALRLDAEVGSLVPGKEADLAVFSPVAGGFPDGDPVRLLVERPSAWRATRAFVAGAQRMRDGVVKGFDPAIPVRVAAAGERVTEWRRRSTVG